MSTSIKIVHTISAPAGQVYRAFTNATALREWLCDTATVQSSPGGRCFLAWNSGYYACGEYTKLQPDREVSVIWNGRDDPAPTRVTVMINALDNGSTTLAIEQTGLENTPLWERTREEISSGWENGLKNLASVLENGPDLRIVTRPMIGIMFGEFNKKRAAELNIPVTEGLYIEGVIDGMGAQKAGMLHNDVIISINNKPTTDFAHLANTLQGLKAGDEVEVGIYRGPGKKRLHMVLSQRPMPAIPATAKEFGNMVRKRNDETDAALAVLLDSVTEAEASFKPKKDGWSVKENLAHLIHGERENHIYIHDLIFSQERVADGFTDNLPARVSATVTAYGTMKALFEEVKRSEVETTELLTNLPEDFCANKARFWRLAFSLLQFPTHTNEHIAQIKTTIEAARK
jgi:uncharacterized protein YndB with AHSA1/START domain